MPSLPPSRSSDTVAELNTGRGRIVVARLRPGLLHSTASGHICSEIVQTLMDAADTEIAAVTTEFEHFLDWTDVESYDTAARVTATRWAMNQSPPYPRLHIVTKNRLLNMGVAAASLALEVAGRPLHAYLSLESFERELRARCA